MIAKTQAHLARLPSNGAGSQGVIGAIVVGGDYQGLGIVRSLGRQGVPVCVIDDEHSIARFSHYTTHFVGTKSLFDQRRCVEAVLETGRRLDLRGWVLYPTRDETVAAFSHYRVPLAKFFRVPTPAWTIAKWAWDKRNTHRLATDLGIPTARTWYPRTVGELDQIQAEPPFAVKPAIKEHFIYATKAKAWRANNRSELRELFRQAFELVGPGEVMIQDLIPGGGDRQLAYCAFFKGGQSVGSMVVRRTRQHPPEFGRASTFVETIEHPELESLSERFLRAINYYGLVELEYKHDPRDGQYKLLDVNARTWGYHTLGPRAGVDFVYMLFADQIGQPVGTCRAQPGLSWIRLLTDTPTSIGEILRGRQGWSAWLHSLRMSNIESVFNGSDPLPGFAELALFPYLAIKRGF
jgi:predicted ATP-grasp superfamily ATP-dependent carboligase